MTENAVVQSDGGQVMTPANLLSIAINKGSDLDQLKTLMDLQERHQANEAKKAYTKAMAAFRADPPIIVKDQKVEYKNTKYSHATLGQVATVINAALGEHGLSAGWKTEQSESGSVTVTCSITHIDGHSESTSLTAPPDATGSKNAIQAIGSTVSYLQRYTILAITGLATSEHDDDGRSHSNANPEPEESPEEISLRILDRVANKIDSIVGSGTLNELEEWYSKAESHMGDLTEADRHKVDVIMKEARSVLCEKEDTAPETVICPETNKEMVKDDCLVSECSKECEHFAWTESKLEIDL